MPAGVPAGERRLLPSLDAIKPFLDQRASVQLLWFVRTEPTRDVDDVLGPVLAAGARIEWSGRTESILIGPDPVYWSHAILAVAPAAVLADAAARNVAVPGIESLALWVVEPQAIPAPVRWLFRALRPVGRLLERDPREAVRHRPVSMDESDINPSQERLEKLVADPRSGRTTMINLLRFRDQADYGDGAKPVRSGRAAYRRYGIVAARSVAMLGGGIAHVGRLRGPLLEVEGRATTGPWDDLAIVHYPAPSSIVKLEAMPGYANALHHRSAALERSTIVVARQRGGSGSANS